MFFSRMYITPAYLSDGDMWPLRPSYFNQIDVKKSMCIMNANDYRRDKPDYWNAYRYFWLNNSLLLDTR